MTTRKRYGRNPAPLTPLTDAERADVARWAALGAKLAIEKSAGLQPADRDDAVGEAFLQMCRSIKTYDPRKRSLGTHLGTAARWGASEAFQVVLRDGLAGLKAYQSADAILAAKPQRVALEDALGVEVPALADRRELPAAVRAAIDALPERLGQIVRWRYLDQWTLRDIGRRLRVTPERVNQLSLTALMRLRADLTTTRTPAVATGAA